MDFLRWKGTSCPNSLIIYHNHHFQTNSCEHDPLTKMYPSSLIFMYIFIKPSAFSVILHIAATLDKNN